MSSLPNNVAGAYAKVATLEEHIAEAQGNIRRRINQLKAELKYMERLDNNLDEMGRKSVSMLQNEAEIVKMMGEKDASGKTELEQFMEDGEDVIAQAAGATDKGTTFNNA